MTEQKRTYFISLATINHFKLSHSIEMPLSRQKAFIYVRLLFSSAFCSAASEVYALKDDEKGHIINHVIHHLPWDPDRRGPTEVLTLYLLTPEIAPRKLADLPSPVGKPRAREVSVGTERTGHMQQQEDRAVLLGPPPYGHLGHLRLPKSWPWFHLTCLAVGGCGWCSSPGEPSWTHFSPNQTS